ncbi:MAG: ABC transporter ATP-binding protein [Dehalococcoidia bacterium]|jgi:putative ABC transport system ATP-binding protein|nr:ABC transporter ATP-binding protein [Dehalococcoidia bacterium]
MIEVIDLHKTYGRGTAATRALNGINLSVRPGEFVAIMGRSGSGKSTLLHILGLLDSPTRGQFFVQGRDMLKLTETERSRFRLEEFGYVFQEYSLLPGMSILENVCVPAIGLGKGNNIRKRATDLLQVVGLGERLKHQPGEVSGGEQQRAAIARALINRPAILFADEPTASLDVTSSRVVLELFRKLNKELGQTIVMVTHEPDDRQYVDRVVWLKDGLIATEDGHPRFDGVSDAA